MRRPAVSAAGQFTSIKIHGVLPATDENPHIAPIYIHINKDGEILNTMVGNHRYAMCKVLGIKKIPVRVWMRHKKWQEKREIILGNRPPEEREKLIKQFQDHSDINFRNRGRVSDKSHRKDIEKR